MKLKYYLKKKCWRLAIFNNKFKNKLNTKIKIILNIYL